LGGCNTLIGAPNGGSINIGASTATMTPTPTITPTPACYSGPSLALQLRYNAGDNPYNFLRFQYKIINNSTAAVDATKITFKVWFNHANTVTSPIYYGNINSAGSGDVLEEIVSNASMGPCGAGSRLATNAVNVSFASYTGTTLIAPSGDYLTDANGGGYIQIAQTTTNWSNDYSQIPTTQTAFTSDIHYALYYNGQLVSGDDPCGATPLPTCISAPLGFLAQALAISGTENKTATITPTPISTSTPTFTPTVTVTTTPTSSGLFQSAVAAPNISRNGQPVKFMVNLGSNATIQLSLFSLTGEEVFSDMIQGNPGLNTITWFTRNKAQVPVARGLYVFTIQVSNGSETITKRGKLVVFH